VLLHAPSVRARELARAGEGDSFSAAVTALFGVDVSAATPATADLQDLQA